MAKSVGLVVLLAFLMLACQNTEEFNPQSVPTLIALESWTPTDSPTPSITPTATQTPTLTLSPTQTPSHTITDTPEPSQTPSQTHTPTATPILGLTIADEIPVYRGPAREFEIAQTLPSGSFLSVLQRVINDAEEAWYLVRLENTVEGWLAEGDFIFEEGAQIPNLQIAQVVSRTPTPTYTPSLTPTYTPSLTLTPSDTPSRTPTFTRTPTSTNTPTRTATPTRTPSPTPTIPPEADARITALRDVNLRDGPGEDFPIIGSLAVDELVAVVGRNPSNDWYQVTKFGTSPLIGWVASNFVQGGQDFSTLPITWYGVVSSQIGGIACGLNLDPLQDQTNQTLPAQWVRLPFRVKPDAFPELRDAFIYYDPIINAYNDAGLKVMLILDETSPDSSQTWDWIAMEEARWREFRQIFVGTVERIAQHYGNRVAAYQLWGTLSGELVTDAAFAMPPDIYLQILTDSNRIIRAYSPQTQIILGGMSNDQTSYLELLSQLSGGNLPIDGLSLNLYGYGAPYDNTPYSELGDLGDLIARYTEIAPGIPLWFTEVGTLGADQPTAWADVADYLRNSLEYLQVRHTNIVSGFFWYPWSETMAREWGSNALITRNRRPRSPILETFEELCI